VAGCCECSDEPSGSCATELVKVSGAYEGEWNAERDRAYSNRLKLTGSPGHVTVDAQNRPKLGLLRMCRSLWRMLLEEK
jgi:hypothetical protein